jgi:hypothetical protein
MRSLHRMVRHAVPIADRSADLFDSEMVEERQLSPMS